MPTSASFPKALALFESAHREDPKTIVIAGAPVPWSLFFHQALVIWVEKLAPEGSEVLRIAARCQHIRRWQVPRESYPEGREGYLRWRSNLARFHGEQAEAILLEAGYGSETIDAVKRILLKRGLKRDPETQVMEDALCLVFLEHEFQEFCGKHDKDKVVDIVRKTWAKMSPAGHEAALALPLPPETGKLVKEALECENPSEEES